MHLRRAAAVTARPAQLRAGQARELAVPPSDGRAHPAQQRAEPEPQLGHASSAPAAGQARGHQVTSSHTGRRATSGRGQRSSRPARPEVQPALAARTAMLSSGRRPCAGPHLDLQVGQPLQREQRRVVRLGPHSSSGEAAERRADRRRRDAARGPAARRRGTRARPQAAASQARTGRPSRTGGPPSRPAPPSSSAGPATQASGRRPATSPTHQAVVGAGDHQVLGRPAGGVQRTSADCKRRHQQVGLGRAARGRPRSHVVARPCRLRRDGGRLGGAAGASRGRAAAAPCRRARATSPAAAASGPARPRRRPPGRRGSRSGELHEHQERQPGRPGRSGGESGPGGVEPASVTVCHPAHQARATSPARALSTSPAIGARSPGCSAAPPANRAAALRDRRSPTGRSPAAATSAPSTTSSPMRRPARPRAQPGGSA